MLFTFPASALNCNWLSPRIVETLLGGIVAVDAGNKPEVWPDCLPADRRDTLRRRTGLQSKLQAFWTAYSSLPAADKANVRNAIVRQTSLPELFSDFDPCPSLDDLPPEISNETKTLAEYLFGQLAKIQEGDKALRDLQFSVIHDSGIRTCPFCGLSYFRPVGLLRNALDHLLPISKYPFASADLRNLPPTCHECNSIYKRDIDIIVEEGGGRRVCSDPYAGPVFQVSLEGSELNAGNEIRGVRMPRWEINLLGDSPAQAATWDTVYKIKTRYEVTLDADFVSWIRHFALWFVRERGRGRTALEVADELPRYICNVLQDGFDDRSFLKAEAFKLLERSCNDAGIGNEAREWLWSFIEYAV